MYLKYFFFIDLRWINIRTTYLVSFNTGKVSLNALILQTFQ